MPNFFVKFSFLYTIFILRTGFDSVLTKYSYETAAADTDSFLSNRIYGSLLIKQTAQIAMLLSRSVSLVIKDIATREEQEEYQ